MKTLFRIFLITGIFIAIGICVTAQASDKDVLEIGTEIYYYNYEEPNFMEDTGMFYGVNASYEKYFSSPLSDNVTIEDDPHMVRIDGRFAYGMVDYTSAGTGDLDGVDDFIIEARAVTGYDTPVGKLSVLRPYFGFGYRYLNDDTSGEITTTGFSGYERESNYFYVPIGIDLMAPINPNWIFGANVEFDVFLYGKQKSHLGDAVAGLNSVESDQEEGYGVRGSIEFQREGEMMDFFAEPFVRFWHIGDSETSAVTYGGVLAGYGLEPENNTVETGLKLGVRF